MKDFDFKCILVKKEEYGKIVKVACLSTMKI
jgi:hypothetical protein